LTALAEFAAFPKRPAKYTCTNQNGRIFAGICGVIYRQTGAQDVKEARREPPIGAASMSQRKPQVMMPRSLAPLSLMLFAACCVPTSDMKLYPLQGPIAEATPTLVIDVAAKNIDKASGPISFRLPGKVKCQGTWTTVAPREISKSRGLSLSLHGPRGNLANESKTAARVNTGEIYAVCSDATKVQGNFLIGSGTLSGTGRASDSNGNVYKLLF
jgi:hypothetical protein